MPETNSRFEQSSVSSALLVSMIEHDHRAETRRSGTTSKGIPETSKGIPEIDGVFKELLIDQAQQTWRKLDKKYTPYCDAPLDRRQVYLAGNADTDGAPRDSAEQSATCPSNRRSLTVGDWLSLAVDGSYGRPKSEDQVKMLHNDLESSIDLLERGLQIPKDMSPFNSLRMQEPAQQLEEHDRPVDVSRDGNKYLQATSYRSPCSQRYSGRTWASYSLSSDRRPSYKGKSEFRMLEDWKTSHVSLKDSIDTAKKKDRPRTTQHNWALPKKPGMRSWEEPGALTKFVVSSQLKAVKDNDFKVKTELDDNLMEIYHAAEQAQAEEEDMEAWRKNLHFSIFRGGFTHGRDVEKV